MSTYRMTPAERRARAQAIVQYRENYSSYKKYLQQQKEAKKQLEEERLKSVWADNEKESQNFFTRGLSTIGDIVGNVITGAVKGLEGIVDLGIGAVGAVGGIFDSDFQETMKNAVAYDWTGKTIGDPLQEALRYSYLKEDGIIENVASGIGQMLPAVAVTVATGGAGAPATLSQAASLITMGTSAAGNATEEAFNEDANYYAGLGYGVASGLVEVGTEKLFGGATKALTGAGIFDGITQSVADTGIKRIAKNAIEEGLEEIAAEVVSPALKSIYKGKDALSDYRNLDYWKGVGEAGLVGSLTALAYSGTVGYGLSKFGVGYSGKEADIADSLTEINALKEKAINFQAEDKLDAINERKIAETTRKNYQNIEETLKKSSTEKRAKLIEKFSLQSAFNPDGSMTAKLSSWLNESRQVGQASTEDVNGAATPIKGLKKSSYSFNLRGNEQTIQSDLDRLSEERAQAYLKERQTQGENVTIEQAREKVEKFSALESELSDKAKESRRKFNKALNALNKLSGLDTSFVITESNDTFNATVVDGRMYINADTFENDSWAGALVHEYTHLEEGSAEYAKMSDFLQSDDILVEVKTQEGIEKIPLWQKAQSAVLGKDYGFDENQVKVIADKVNTGVELTEEERKIYNAFTTEVAAHETEYLLGNESFIDKIVSTDSSFARKIVEKISNLKKAFVKVGEKGTRAELKMLRKAEKLYLDAARKAGDMRLVKFILGRDPELEEEVDSGEGIQYNREKTARYIPYEKVGDEVIRHIKTELKKIYNNEDGVADGIAIEHGSDVYIVDSGRENGSTTFGVRRRRRISDARLRAEFIRSTNNDAISKRFVSDEISSRIGNGPGGDSGRNMRRESRTELQTDSRESQDNQGGVLGENADNGRVSNAILSDQGGVVRFNLSTYKEGGRVILEKNLVSKGFAKADVEAALKTMDDLASFFEEVSTKYKDVADWNNAEVYYDDQGRAIYSAMVNNGDYPLNIDLSTICRKRKALTRVLNELVKRDLIGGLSLTADNIVKINDILKKNGFEVACPACFVETKRYRAESWANDFIDAWNGVIDTLNIKGVETLDFSHGKTTVSNGDVDTSGLEAAVKKSAFGGRENNLIAKTILEHPELRGRLQKGDFFGTVGLDTMKKVAPDLYTRILNKAGSATPKITQEFTPYNSELGLFDKLAEKAKGVGGVRMFSFSDFTIEQVFDYMQVVADLASQKATMHTYTKVISFAKIFGKTGIKINMSMIPNVDKTVARENAGLDSKGNLIWSEYGVDYNEAIALMSEEGYSENVGTATIGISDAHIRKLLANKYTNYIIPYHKSNINPIVAKMTAIDWYTDYTSQQSTRYRNGVGENIRYSEGQTEKHPGKPTKVSKTEEFNFFESLDRLGDAKAMAREYLAYCDEHGFVPKFEQFTAEKNYYKLLVDFQVYDTLSGQPALQRPAELVFPDNIKSLIEEELDIQEEAKIREAEVFEGTLGEIVSAISYKGENIRFNLVDDPTAKPYFYELTDGQVKKLLANSTKMKVYKKVEAESIINTVLEDYMGFGARYGYLSGKTKAEAVEMLWRGLNTADSGKRGKVALDVADYIIKNAVVENTYQDENNQVYIDTIALLKPYLHKINLDGIKGDISHRYGRDNSPYALWGKRKGDKGKGADVVAMELEEQGFYIDSINPAEIFFQIHDSYREAVNALKKQAKQMLDASFTEERLAKLRQDIAAEVLRGFSEKGKPSKFSNLLEEYAKKAKVWKEKYYDERTRNYTINRLLDSVQKIKDIKLGTFLNSTQFKSDIFKGSIERLSNIKYRGDLNKSGTRKIVAGLQEWYSEKNPILGNSFDEEISSMLKEIAAGEGDLTTNELRMLSNVVDYFKHFIENYNKVYRNGKYVDAQPIAEKYIDIIHANKAVKVGWLPRLFDKVFNNANGSYLQTFADPMTVARYMDMYDQGFYSEMLATLRLGATKAQIDEMEMREPIEEFFNKHKKYLQDIEKRTVKYLGQELPAREALALYMTLGREQALTGLAESGFEYHLDGKESVRINGFAVGEELTLDELKQRAGELQKALANQFTEADIEYIEIAQKLFNKVCRNKKRDTDLLRRGYSNISEGEYVPIRRANISHSVDTSSLEFELNRVSNASFNKDTVKGAKNELFIEPLDRVLDRHIRAIAQYANLSLVLDEYDKLYSLDIGGNPNKAISVKSEGKNTWAKGDEYFRKLISDIQGIPATKGDGLRAVSYIRGSYAKYQLGANPKVWLTQLSSFGAAINMLDVGSIVKGMAIKTDDVDQYCSLAKLRNSDNTAAMAQGVLDRSAKTGKVIEKVNKAGDLLMKPIGMVDRFVVKKLFGACQVQVEKNNGLKVGTEENKIKAGELLEKVILETQQNSMATERSSAMRSGSELMRTITMFSADSMKVIGRVVDSVGELSVLKAKRKATTDPDEIAKLDKKIKTVNKKVVKSTAALATTATFMAVIAQLFRWLYNKDDENEDIVQNMTVDGIGNLLGGLPLIRDVYSRFAEGYDISDYTYSALNDLLDSGYNIFEMTGDLFSGKATSQDVAKNIKNMFYAAGQILGLPTRNVYNMIYGLTNRISPSTGYKVNSMFYNQGYRSDLKKAIENGDEAMISTIAGLILDENFGTIENKDARKALTELIEAGYNVIPKSVVDSITYEGEEIVLTSRQAEAFKKIYYVANEAIAELAKLSQYQAATDDVKAKTVKFIYDTYYNLAIEDFLGVDLESKNILFAEAIDIEKLALIVSTARTITSDFDKNGKVINGSRKTKIQSYVNSLKLTAVQKYMIMGYLGYTNKHGEAQVKAYINRLNLTKAEKEKLLAYSGY